MVESSNALYRWEHLVSIFSAKICWAAGALLIGMVALGVLDVTMRRFFSFPIKGAYEVIALLAGIAIALPIAYTQTQRAHIAIEVLPFPKRVQAVLDSIARFLSLVVFSMLTWQLGVLGADFWRVGQVSDTLGFPIFPFIWGAAFGCALMSAVLLMELSSSVVREMRK